MARGKGLPYDYSLRLYRDVFDLDHLHFGLWEPGDPLDLEHLKAAQERYAERLLDSIPDGARTVLDVGCGTGSTSERLLGRGYEVDSLSPCEHQESLVRERLGERVGFHRSTFEGLCTDRRYDLVLMSESSQYVPRRELFKKALEVLAPGGHLLVADYYRLGRTRTYRAAHRLEPFLALAAEDDFEVVSSDDITDGTAPTMLFARQIYERYALPIAEIAGEYARREHPRVVWLARRLFPKRLRRLAEGVYERPRAKFDDERFRSEVRYLIQLFRQKSG